jgi:hypothetical protein
MNIPNLSGIADPKNISQKGTGKFTADYINWARTLADIREHAQGWMPELVENIHGEEIHPAPDGSGYLMIRFRHEDGTKTASIPHAIMDHRMQSVIGDKISARDVADSFVRGACKSAAALFGYAWQMWSKDDPMARDQPAGDPIKEGKIRQSTNNPLPKKVDASDASKLMIWPGKKKHTGKTLGEIMDKDPAYLKGVLNTAYEVLKESDPTLLKAIETLVSKSENNGKQDFKEAA